MGNALMCLDSLVVARSSTLAVTTERSSNARTGRSAAQPLHLAIICLHAAQHILPSATFGYHSVLKPTNDDLDKQGASRCSVSQYSQGWPLTYVLKLLTIKYILLLIDLACKICDVPSNFVITIKLHVVLVLTHDMPVPCAM